MITIIHLNSIWTLQIPLNDPHFAAKSNNPGPDPVGSDLSERTNDDAAAAQLFLRLCPFTSGFFVVCGGREKPLYGDNVQQITVTSSSSVNWINNLCCMK